jgi:hypothetical protein
VARKIICTLTSNNSDSVHTSLSPIFLYKLCSIATPKHSEPLLPENYVRIVALSPDLWTVSIYSATEFLHHSSTIELLSLLKLIKRVIPELWGLTTILEIVISLVAAVARKFMQDRHTGRYSKLRNRLRPSTLLIKIFCPT